jgi:predicted deacylase
MEIKVMGIEEVITKLEKVQSAGRVQVVYRVIPKQFLKERRYKDLNKMTQEFSKEELRGASITVVINAASVGKLDTEKVLDELYT